MTATCVLATEATPEVGDQKRSSRLRRQARIVPMRGGRMFSSGEDSWEEDRWRGKKKSDQLKV